MLKFYFSKDLNQPVSILTFPIKDEFLFFYFDTQSGKINF